MNLMLNLLNFLTTQFPNLTDWNAWESTQKTQADAVVLYRDYALGKHRSKMTSEMAQLLRIPNAAQSPFNLNHCNNILQTLVDRLQLTTVEGDTTESSQWASELLASNKLDGLQFDIHEAALRDGDTYLMVSPNPQTGEAELTHEPAYNGYYGILMIYTNSRAPLCALKIWIEGVDTGVDNSVNNIYRVNAYFPDRIEYYINSMGLWREFSPSVQWLDRQGNPIGIPVIPFRNRAQSTNDFGVSELADIIATQDAVNRTLVSMVMTSELTAFPIRIAIGAKPPAALTPGMWFSINNASSTTQTPVPNEAMVNWFNSIRLETMAQGELVPFLQQLTTLISQMYDITRTPPPNSMAGDNLSGESLKQREVALLGKVRRAQVAFGNAWEQALKIASTIEATFSAKIPPTATRYYARWQPASMRDDSAVIANAAQLKGDVDQRTYLEMIAPVYGWDSAKIDAILQAKQAEQSRALSQLAQTTFGTDAGRNLDNAL